MNIKLSQHGFSLVELMIAFVLGLIVNYAVLEVYLAQTEIYKTTNSQNLILNTENAVSQLITPVIRGAGFFGCSSISTAMSILNSGGPSPLGTFNTNGTMIYGYSGSGASFTMSQDNAANDASASDWSPTLDSTLVGQVEKGSDVLTVLGAAASSQPVNVTAINSGSTSFTVQSIIGSNVTSGQFATISDCAKSIIFTMTGVSGTTITHNSGSSSLQNSTSTFPVNFQIGAQFIPLQQTVFFVGQGEGGESSLMEGTLNGSSWVIQPLVPGIDIMKVLYGIGTNNIITQYVTANNVTNWSQVYSVRIGFLMAGQKGSGAFGATTYTVLNTSVTAPSDGRLRHVFEITINLRNAQ